ncbi:MAG: hypothetical protein EVB11_12935, partial [Winogradskyella sp.]
NLSSTDFDKALKDKFTAVKLYNFWGIYYFLKSDASQRYKDILRAEINENKNRTLTQMGLYLEDGNLKNSVPKENVSFYSYDTFNNALEIYRLDLREAEILQQIEKQTGIKQGKIQSKIDIEKVLTKLIAPENRTVYWQKTPEGFEINKTFGPRTADVKVSVEKIMQFGNHAIGQDLVFGNQYVLRNFYNAQPDIKYEALEYNKDINFWIKKGNSAIVSIGGEISDLATSQSYESPVDRVINYKGKYYILGDFKNAIEGKIYTTNQISAGDYEISKGLKAPSTGVYWKHYGRFYYLVKDGEYIDFEVEHNFIGNDVIVYHPKTNSTYILKDYQLLNDGKWRAPITVDSNQAVWIKFDNGNFNCYEKATKSITTNKWSTENSKDLWVMDYNNKPKYVLKDFKTVKTNAFYVAERYGDKSKSNIPQTNTKIVATSIDQETNNNKTLTVSQDPNIECIEGNCNNGYGKVRLLNNETMEGFFENGVANGPLFLRNPKTKLETFTTYKGNYTEPIGFEYNGTVGESTLLIDRDLGMALVYSPQDNKFAVMIVSGSDIQKSITLEPNANSSCQVGNCKDGAGFYVYSNGTTYMGFFKNGKSHGPGQLNFTNNQFYIGNFSNGQKDGLGTYVWDSDTNYFGEWKNDKYHGKGVYHYSSSNKKAGLWQNGTYIKSLDGIQPTSNKSNISNSDSSKSVSKYNLSEAEETAILKCRDDNSCLTKVFDAKYEQLKKTMTGDALGQTFADYALALNTIKPGKLFSIFMRSNYAVSSGIFDILPKEEMTKIRKQAQELMDGYNKHINSKETRDAVKKHGGGFIKQ